MAHTVTVITTAYNAEQFIGEALRSALGQTYPAELVDFVVVDDGSTDSSAEIVRSIAAEDGRVRLIQQENAGNARAFNAGLAAARGELIALLDSDDAWPADKLERQAARFDANPHLTMVYGDMHVVDADGATVEESWLDLIWDGDPPTGHRCAGPLLVANAATASSLLLRASAIGPIPDAIPMADWWLAIEAARGGTIEYLAEPRTRYRMHDDNIGLGAEGSRLRDALKRRLAVQRWFLRRMPPGELSGDELLAVWDSFEHNAMAARRVGESAFEPLFDIAPGDRRECEEAIAAAATGNTLANAMHAAACVPWSREARAALDAAMGRTRPDTVPVVSALMVVYNGERFIGEAIDSALAQDFPADDLELVVVDDGSTDSTPAILASYAAAHPGRIRVLRQANAGNTGATNTAIANARGEFLALIDADDVWPADKIRRQVDLMRARPQIGLIYTDMHVIDGAGKTVQASWLEGDDPPRGRCLGRLLAENPCTASSVMIRASVAESIGPIPPELPFADWWLAANTARMADIGYMPEPRTLYRHHEDNMSLGTKGKTRARELGRAMRQSRWLLQRLEPGDATDAELWDAWVAFERNGHEAFGLLDDPFPGLIGATPEDRADAAALVDSAARALRRGDASEALLLSIRAAATHPWTSSARFGVAGAYSATAAGVDLPGQTPLAGALPYVVRVPVEELDDVLGSYAVAMAGLPGVTLAIDASLMTPEAGEAEIARLTTGVDLDGIDAVAVLGPLDEVGRARLLCGTHAVLTSGAPDADAVPPVYDVAALAALRGGRVPAERVRVATATPRWRRRRVPRLAAALGAALVGLFSAGGAAQQPADDDDPAVTISDRDGET